MKNKVTLITPPDIYENSSNSVLFINVQDRDQEKITNWLSNSESEENINIYFYSGEQETEWLLYALSRADLTFFDVDNHCGLTQLLAGYIISMNKVYYQTQQADIGQVYQHINSRRVPDMDFFLSDVLQPFHIPNK